MLAALFLNPGFLFIGAALISLPIIIHLINRMRFKRIRWAAMEFLLKAQKRTRRRLIIEQLLLLALRCFLIALVGLLVSRFVGCSSANLTNKPNLHLVLLDDTLSMQDQWKEGEQQRTCFDVAKNDVLLKKIGKGLSLSKTNDRLIILPLSKLHDAELKTYEGLNNTQRFDELKTDIVKLQPSMLHVPILDGIKAAEKIIDANPDNVVTLHVLGDFRQKDWGLPSSEKLYKELFELIRKNHERDIKIRLVDTADPSRAASTSSHPVAHDNVGIVDFRPGTRTSGKNMPVQFTVSIQNFSGKQFEANLQFRDEVNGKDMLDVSSRLNPPNPVKLAPDAVTVVTFEHRFEPPPMPAGQSYYAHLSARLTNAAKQPLDNDGLLGDNLRHTMIEVREKVPVLVIDGLGAKGRDKNKDSFFINNAFDAVPGESFQVFNGDELDYAKGNAVNALDRADLLSQYPAIFMLNVPDLNAKQLANLENYVKDGGGVAFYLGPQVNVAYYNRFLYKDGKGIFPAPLHETIKVKEPSQGESKAERNAFQLLIRDEKYTSDMRNMPIFGAILPEPKLREPLRDLPINQYYQVNRAAWKQEPDRVLELATLPNDDSILKVETAVLKITDSPAVSKIRANDEFAAYRGRLQEDLAEIKQMVEPTSKKKTFHLTTKIDSLLTDKKGLDMPKFWLNPDPSVQELKTKLLELREQVRFGDPLVVAARFGKGKVVAVMTTAGKDWNKWAGGSEAASLFQPFVWETQNYLSSLGSEADLTVGANVQLRLDPGQHDGAQIKMVRHFMKTEENKPAEKVKHGDPKFGKAEEGQVLFNLTNHLEPGLYVTELFRDNDDTKPPFAVYTHVFNVDTEREGQLQRTSNDDLELELVRKSDGAIKLVAPTASEENFIGKRNDFSESPWLFLIFLLVLVAEQALAVHLSFHLKNNESDLAPAVRAPQQAA